MGELYTRYKSSREMYLHKSKNMQVAHFIEYYLLQIWGLLLAICALLCLLCTILLPDIFLLNSSRKGFLTARPVLVWTINLLNVARAKFVFSHHCNLQWSYRICLCRWHFHLALSVRSSWCRIILLLWYSIASQGTQMNIVEDWENMMRPDSVGTYIM